MVQNAMDTIPYRMESRGDSWCQEYEFSKEIPGQRQIVKIALGSVCVEIQCHDQELLEKMLVNYHPFLVSHQPDFRIILNLRNSLAALEVKELLNISRSHVEGNRLFTRPELLELRVDWAQATLRVDTERELFSPLVDYKLMNLLLRGIYYGIFTRVKHNRVDEYLVHGCGIVDGDKCYLFTGPSGSGKTTLAGLAEGRKVLNDEAVLIGRNQDGFYISGTPFEGGILEKHGASGHISAIFFLKHDTQASLRKMSKAETYYKLLAQIFDTTPLLETDSTGSLQERADISAQVAIEVPSYELGFRPDTSFWRAIEST